MHKIFLTLKNYYFHLKKIMSQQLLKKTKSHVLKQTHIIRLLSVLKIEVWSLFFWKIFVVL